MAEPSLRKFQPSASTPWNRAKAAHLLSRAGFGGSPDEIDRLAAIPFPAAVDSLLNFESVPDADFPAIDFSEIRELYAELFRLRQSRAGEQALRQQNQRIIRANLQKFQDIRAAWVTRMIQTRRPLEERLVLFWHGLLVSGLPEVRNAEHMAMQLDLFRRSAAGNFKQLILDISRDPAMLGYLDNDTNRRGRPNENYARELMELFTLGVGNYTEADVKESARAFTGWTFAGNQFVFQRNQHDDGQKTFLGRTGNFDGTDVIDIIFEQPAAARHLSRKLFEHFVYLGPEEAVVNELAEIFKRTNWDVKSVLRAIFQSDLFYSEKALRSQIKSPVRLVIGAVRATGARIPEPGLVRAMDLMGQALLYPPNVGGWPAGRGWINTATILVRYNFSNLLLGGAMPGVGGRRQAPARIDWLDASKAKTCGDVIDQLADRLLNAPLDARRRWGLLRALGTNREDEPFVLDGERTQQQLRSAVHLVMSMPEYQLS
ncbi:MAG TPA: DUF1800 domain-containing protein [bacterium]|jgi:hypothetical protein|nr:DUF1800 domain-containing protein [bacterium]